MCAPSDPDHRSGPRLTEFSPIMARASSALLLLGLILLAVGLHTTQALDVLPLAHARLLACLAVLACILGAILWRWRRWPLASALVAITLLAHIAMVGPMPLLGTLWLATAALALGSGLARGSGGGPVLALLIGLALIAGVGGWLLPLKLHHDWVYALVLTAIILACRRALVRECRRLLRQWNRTVSEAPAMASLAVLALALASTSSWLPTVQYDDLAYHLAMPAQLQALGYYRMDPASQVWALAPWAGDLLHALVQVLVGSEARGSVNLIWLAAGGWLLAQLCRALGLPATLAWLGVLLYASMPLTAFLLGGMQTEGPGTAALLGLAMLIQGADRALAARVLPAAAVIAGFMLALKASFALPLAILGGWLAWQLRASFPWRVLPRAIALALLVGASSYTFAWALTGNPVLPLFNGLFQSPYFPASHFFDARYSGSFSIDLPWRLIFHSHEYFEGRAGAGGFHLIGLGGLLAVALTVPRARALAVAGLLMLLAMLLMAQYLRYAHPAMVLLLAPMLAGAAAIPWRTMLLAAGCVLGVLNLSFQANASWILHVGAVRMLVDSQGDSAKVLARFAPERLLVTGLHRHSRVLVAGRAFHAELAGRGFVLNWYDPALNAERDRLIAAGDAAAIQRFLRQYGFTHVLIGGPPEIPDLDTHLRALGAVPVNGVYDAVLWQLPDSGLEQRRDLMRERDLATQMRRAWR
jgi:hypothetical protein